MENICALLRRRTERIHGTDIDTRSAQKRIFCKFIEKTIGVGFPLLPRQSPLDNDAVYMVELERIDIFYVTSNNKYLSIYLYKYLIFIFICDVT